VHHLFEHTRVRQVDTLHGAMSPYLTRGNTVNVFYHFVQRGDRLTAGRSALGAVLQFGGRVKDMKCSKGDTHHIP
jgi:hypothetical protein